MITLALISGSNRTGRRSHQVAMYLHSLFENHPEVGKVNFLDIHAYNFPVMDERLPRLDQPHPGLQDFSNQLKEADGIVVVSPEYNSGMSGALKNTLDYFYKEYTNKPFGLVAVSDGNFGGVNAMHQMVYFVNHINAFLLNGKLLVSNVNEAFTPEGEPRDERLIRNSGIFRDKMVWFTKAIRQAGLQD